MPPAARYPHQEGERDFGDPRVSLLPLEKGRLEQTALWTAEMGMALPTFSLYMMIYFTLL